MSVEKYAYFLPQFYPTPENDKYWGEGFTEWTNVKSAKKLFKSHKQPIEPAEFGYYNLLEDEVLKGLSQYAQKIGIDGFGYWHYWFGNGFQTLQKVPEIHLCDKSITQKFFFSWANLNWSKAWIGEDTLIFKQQYSDADANQHFDYLQKFINDDRYVRIDGKPMIQVLNPNDPGCLNHIYVIEKLVQRHFGAGVKWVFPSHNSIQVQDLDILISGYPPGEVIKKSLSFKLKTIINKTIISKPIKISERSYLKNFEKDLSYWIQKKGSEYVPVLLSGWDNTPRYGKKGFIIDSDNEKLLMKQMDSLKRIYTNHSNQINPPFVIIKAFNEWAEGNILEPYHKGESNTKVMFKNLDEVI